MNLKKCGLNLFQRKINHMIKKIYFYISLLFFNILISNVNSSEIDIYKKIDLFGEVLENK